MIRPCNSSQPIEIKRQVPFWGLLQGLNYQMWRIWHGFLRFDHGLDWIIANVLLISEPLCMIPLMTVNFYLCWARCLAKETKGTRGLFDLQLHSAGSHEVPHQIARAHMCVQARGHLRSLPPSHFTLDEPRTHHFGCSEYPDSLAMC